VGEGGLLLGAEAAGVGGLAVLVEDRSGDASGGGGREGGGTRAPPSLQIPTAVKGCEADFFCTATPR